MSDTSYLKTYNEQLKVIDNFKQQTMQAIVTLFKTVQLKPVHIGNHVFFYTQHKGKEVPAMCHAGDYRYGRKFMPIYDEENTGEFGYTDFKECCRIFDLIYNHVMNGEFRLKK